MALSWETHHDLLKDLWLVRDSTYDQVRIEMRDHHNFNATKSQYSTQFKKWKWRKNMNEAEWNSVYRKRQRRKEGGRESAVYLNGVRIPDARVKKEFSRHVQPSVSYMPAPGSPECPDIDVCTPPSMFSEDVPVTFDQSHMEIVQMKGNHHLPRKIEPLMHETMSSPPSRLSNTTATMYQPMADPDNLPYFEFLDLFRGLNLDKELLQGSFFDTAPSPSLVPSNPVSSIEMEPSEWSLDLDITNPWFENSVEFSPEHRSIGHFYQSFAQLLIPCEPGKHNQDQLDANRSIQQRLPQVLANMPERNRGECDSIIQTLLGPPQLSAAQCLLEVVIYLLSNGHLSHYNSPILQWVVDIVPFSNLATILKTRLPTLQSFQKALFMHGIRIGDMILVNNLLALGTGLEEWARSSYDPLELAMGVGNPEQVNLILDIYEKTMIKRWRPHSHFWSDAKLSLEVARLLVTAGCDLRGRSGTTITGKRAAYDSSPLMAAINRGDIDLVRYLISIGADVNLGYGRRGANCIELTPLTLAVRIRRVDILRLLLENRADVRLQMVCRNEVAYPFTGKKIYPDGVMRFTGTALQLAALVGEIEMVEALLEAGSDINELACRYNGKTALYAAASAKNASMVEYLLGQGADINASGCAPHLLPRPALLIAIENHDYDLVRLLLNSGANPNAPAFGYHGTTLLEAARNVDETGRIVSLLLARGAEDRIELNDFTRTQHLRLQLLQAIGEGDCDRVHRLVDTGVEIDMEPIDYSDLAVPERIVSWDQKMPLTQTTMLHLAIATQSVDLELFSYLLKHTRQNDLQYNGPMDPLLHYAAYWQRLGFVEALLDAGLDINAISSFSCGRTSHRLHLPTALHVASYNGDVDMTSLLLNRGADIDLRVPNAHTALQLCLQRFWHGPRPIRAAQTLDIFELLLSRGADINALAPDMDPGLEFSRGLTALQLVITFLDMAELKPRVITLIHRLLNSGAVVNAPPTKFGGRTALQAASAVGDYEVVLLLLGRGAEINAPPAAILGATALQYAAQQGHIKVLQLLLSKGADVNAQGSKRDGYTALEWASMRGRLDTVQILINAGADSHLPLEQRYVSSLKWAQICGESGVALLLQKHRDKALDEWNKTRVQETELEGSDWEDSDEMETDSDDEFESASSTDIEGLHNAD